LSTSGRVTVANPQRRFPKYTIGLRRQKTRWKITEIVGSVADQEHEAARISFMRRIANAFTRGGGVKGPLDFQGSEDPSTTTAGPYSYAPASEEGTSTVQGEDVVQNAGTTVPPVSDRRSSPGGLDHFGPIPTDADLWFDGPCAIGTMQTVRSGRPPGPAIRTATKP
jgi:hypothetical protein